LTRSWGTPPSCPSSSTPPTATARPWPTFALFDLVGLRLSPRIAKLTEKQLWRPHPAGRYQQWPLSGLLLGHHAQVDLIGEHWDDLVRIGGSLKPPVTRIGAGS